MKLMVIDGNSIVNRAFYGVSQNLSTREGLPTNAIFGFVNILLKLLEEEQPEGLAVAFDLKAPTFRHLAYEGYKAQRKGMPEELAVQMPVLKRLLDAMNIRRYELEGWEADDLLGTMARVNGEEGGQTVVVTGDKDSLQLITDSTTVKLVSTRMGRTTTRNMTPEAFREEYGFDPIHIIDLKALMGDTSDNIPGVKGIGEKTAMALLAQYPSIDDLYANLDTVEVKPAARKKLVEGEGDARMSYDLATIRCEAPMDFHPQDTLRQPFHNDELYQLLLELEFSKLIDKLEVRPTSTPVAQAVEEPPEIRVEGVYLSGGGGVPHGRGAAGPGAAKVAGSSVCGGAPPAQPGRGDGEPQRRGQGLAVRRAQQPLRRGLPGFLGPALWPWGEKGGPWCQGTVRKAVGRGNSRRRLCL